MSKKLAEIWVFNFNLVFWGIFFEYFFWGGGGGGLFFVVNFILSVNFGIHK